MKEIISVEELMENGASGIQALELLDQADFTLDEMCEMAFANIGQSYMKEKNKKLKENI